MCADREKGSVMEARPAVFLDRDGVINEERNYVFKIDEFHFMDGVFAACRTFMDAGYLLVIITNQAGIARGYYTEDDYQDLTDWMLSEFRQQGILIKNVYHCPHHPVFGVGKYRRDCDCRKPGPGMILEAARDHVLDLGRSILVGDKMTDIEAGRAAGIGCCILVSSGHPLDNTDSEIADGVFDNLQDVAIALASDRLHCRIEKQ